MHPLSLEPAPPTRPDLDNLLTCDPNPPVHCCLFTGLGVEVIINSIGFTIGLFGGPISAMSKTPSLCFFYVPLGLVGLTSLARTFYTSILLGNRRNQKGQLQELLKQSTQERDAFAKKILAIEAEIKALTPAESACVAGEAARGEQTETGSVPASSPSLEELRASVRRNLTLVDRLKKIATGISRAMTAFDQTVQRVAPRAVEEGRVPVQEFLNEDDLKHAELLVVQIRVAQQGWFQECKSLTRCTQDLQTSLETTSAHLREQCAQIARLQDQEKVLHHVAERCEKAEADLQAVKSELQRLQKLSPESKIQDVQKAAERVLASLHRD